MAVTCFKKMKKEGGKGRALQGKSAERERKKVTSAGSIETKDSG